MRIHRSLSISKTAPLFVSAFIAMTLTTACSSVSLDKQRQEAKLRLQLGTSLLQQGQYPSALKELLTAQRLDPKDPMTQNNLGLAYYLRQHYPEAQVHFEHALELKNDFSEARNNLARTLIEENQYDRAISELKIALADLTYPEPARTYVNLGLAYYRKGEFTTAKEQFAQALHIDRNHCLGQDMYGRSLMELGNFEGAAQALDNAVLICKSNELKFDEPHYFSGLTYYKLGKTSFAIARMEEVIKINPDGLYARKAESMLKMMK